VRAILEQPPIDLTLAPTVAVDQGTVISHAQSWNVLHRVCGLQILSNIRSNAGLIMALLQKANMAGTPETKKQGIQYAIRTISTLSKSIVAQTNKLDNVFLPQLSDDVAHFTVTSHQVATNYEGEQGMLQTLANKISDLDNAIQQDCRKIAEGATRAVAKALLSEAVIGVSIGLSLLPLPGAAVGGGELSVVLQGAMEAAVSGAAEGMKSKAQDVLLEQIGGTDTLVDAHQRVVEYRSFLISLKETQAILGAYSVVQQQLFVLKDVVETLVKQLQGSTYLLKRAVANLEIISDEIDDSDDGETDPSFSTVVEGWETIQHLAGNLIDSLMASI